MQRSDRGERRRDHDCVPVCGRCAAGDLRAEGRDYDVGESAGAVLRACQFDRMRVMESSLQNDRIISQIERLLLDRADNRIPVSGRDVLNWPEWHALAKRLGIRQSCLRRVRLTLDIEE